MQTGIIYAMSCSCHPERGIRYIGQTSLGWKRRFALHLKSARDGAKYPVSAWIRKHGPENVRVEYLHEGVPVSRLNELEVIEIAKHRAVGLSDLNMTDGGEGTRGWIMPEDVKQKIREKATGRTHSDETKRKLSQYRGDKASFYGKKFSNEQKMKSALSPGRTERKLDPEDIITIRKRYDSGESPKLIAKDYDVTSANICMVGKRKSWKWVK